MREVRLQRSMTPTPLAAEIARTHALALEVSRGLAGETVRLYRALPAVSFGPRDVAGSAYGAAVDVARREGFGVAERTAGGRPVAMHEGTLILDWVRPEAQPRGSVRERFEETAALLVGVLRGLGLDARVGEVPGEYCPGGSSVNVGGTQKVAGLAQRVYPGAAHVGAMLVVEDEAPLARVLTGVYAALGVAWEPRTVGSVGASAPHVHATEVETALLGALAARVRLVPEA